MATKYLDKIGLAYFWGKIKAWCNSLFALDSAVVHKTGTELVQGDKTFKPDGEGDSVNGSVALILRNKYFDRTSANNTSRYNWTTLIFGDKQNEVWTRDEYNTFTGRLGAVECFTDSLTGTTYIRLCCHKGLYSPGIDEDVMSCLRVGVNADGTPFARCISTPETTTAVDDIVTRDWIPKDIRIVHTTDNETIAGTKTFSSSPIVPTPTTSDNSTKVATTAFVKAQGYLTSHQALPSLSLTTSGSGNAITALSVNNHAITATKGSTFLTSHQDISGKVNKSGDTMTGPLTQKHTDLVKGNTVSAWTHRDYRVIDNSGDSGDKPCLSWWRTAISTDKTVSVELKAFKFADESTDSAGLYIVYPASGNPYMTGITPVTSDNSTKIATTAFVKAQGYVTSDTKVQQFEGTINVNRPILSRWDDGEASGTASYAVFDKNITINPNQHTLTASGGFKGNADTATRLYTARTINGVSFDGSANITVADSTKLPLAGGTLTGNLLFQRTTVTRGTTPSSAVNFSLADVRDSAGSRLSLLETSYATDKTCKTSIFAYNSTVATGNNIGSMGIGCDTSGAVYTFAPTPATTDNTTKIATTAFVKAQGYITSSGNTATATKLANARTISLSGAMTGSTSFDGSTNSEISTVWRSCVLGQSSSSSTKPWYKVASCSMSELDDSTITFLVEGTYSWHSTGILKLHVRTETDGRVNLNATEIFWVSCARSIADTLDQYVLVCPTTASPTVELWTKITDPYMYRRFTVLSEGSRAYTWVRWTLFNASTAGQVASITTSGTQIESSITSVSTYCTGNCSGTSSNVTGTVAIANGGTGATTVVGARKALFGETMTTTNSANFAIIGDSWNHCGWLSVADTKTLLGLKSAAYTESSAYATANHTHSNYLTSHQSLANYVTLNSTQDITGSKHFAGGLNKKHQDQDVTVKSPANDKWNVMGFIDKNNQGMLDFNMIQGNNQRIFWIRMYDMNKAQHWVFNIVLPADASSAGYISMPHTYPMSSANTLGDSSHKWGSVWSVNGAIQTSDERVKEDIDVIPNEVLDAWEQVEWLQFKMKDSVRDKGSKARLHSGVIAQRIKSAFDSLNIDPADYGFFCWDEWDVTPASYDEKGNVITAEIPAGEQYSIRYDEALAIEAAYQRRKNKILENRISELETQIQNMLQILESLKGA